MSDDQTLDDETGTTEGETTDIADLRKAANRSGKLAKENADLKRELAFRDAKVDLSSPAAQFFKEHYAEDLSAEAVAAKARELGIPIIGASEQTTGSGTTQTTTGGEQGETYSEQERSSTEERANLAAGSQGDGGTSHTPHPHAEADRAVREAFERGATEEDALAAGVDTIMRAAAAGDTRATWDPSRS